MSDYLPPELLINVLKRLPVKTLLRFRSVCKEWYSLITDPNFISQHLDRSLLTPHTLVRYCSMNPNRDPFSLIEHYSVRFDNNDAFDEYARPEFPFTPLAFFFGIVGSCNGLLCLFDGFLGDDLHGLLLWNPLIGKSVIVPVPGVSFTTGQCPYFYTFGFGFDELRNDYKVVAIMSLEVDESQQRVEVYSLNSGSWREISPKALRCSLPFGAPNVNLNGVVHWVATDYRKPMNDAERSCIVTFRIKDEVLGEIMLPEARSMMLEIMMRVGCVTVLQDTLSYIDTVRDGDPSCWVWVMKKYGVEDSWTLLFQVDTSSILDWPVGFRINGEFVMQASKVSLISYDPESKQVKDLGIHSCDLQEQCYDTFYLGKYVESLVLLDTGTTDGSLIM